MKALLVCFAGMSTSIMVNKINEAAKKKGVDLSVDAVPLSDLEDNLEGIQVILLGPQVRYALPNVQKITNGKVPVQVINTVDYGMMKGEKVLDQIIKLVGSQP